MADEEFQASQSQFLAFQHDPLPDPATHIRLLEIAHGNFEQHVECKVSAFPIDTTPPYYAISYTWGDPSSNSSNITMNGKNMVVGKNCEYVLQQAFTSKASKYFWVDALCINQTGIEEKNHQVAMMGQIYGNAAHVFACVGPPVDDSEFMFEMCERKKRLLEKIHSKIRISGNSTGLPSKDQPWTVPFIIGDHLLLTLQCHVSMSLTTRVRLKKAFLRFMERSYFSRVWILQEIYMGHKVSFCCGSALLLADILLALSMLLNPLLGHRKECLYRYTFGIRSRSVRLLTAIGFYDYLTKFSDIKSGDWAEISTPDMFWAFAFPQLGCLTLASGPQQTRYLWSVLVAIENFRCADVRDKVYGCLSLVDWEGLSKHPSQITVKTY